MQEAGQIICQAKPGDTILNKEGAMSDIDSYAISFRRSMAIEAISFDGRERYWWHFNKMSG